MGPSGVSTKPFNSTSSSSSITATTSTDHRVAQCLTSLTLSSTSSPGTQSLSQIPVEKIEGEAKVADELETFYGPLREILKNLGCPENMIEGIKHLYPKFDKLFIAYAHLYLSIIRSAAALNTIEASTALYELQNILLSGGWAYSGSNKQQQLQHNLTLVKLTKHLAGQLTALGITNHANLLDNFKKIGQLGFIDHRLTKSSVPPTVFWSTVGYVAELIHQCILTVENAQRQSFIQCKESLQATKDAKPSQAQASPEFLSELSLMIASLERYTKYRIKELQAKFHPKWNESNFHQKTEEFCHLSSIVKNGIFTRSSAINHKISLKIAQYACDSKDRLAMLKSVHSFRFMFTLDVIRNFANTLPQCMQEFRQELQPSNEQWILLGNQSFSRMVFISLEMLQEALLAKTSEEKQQKLQKLNQHFRNLEKQDAGQHPKAMRFNEMICKVTQKICETIVKQYELYKGNFATILPKDLHEELEIHCIPLVVSTVKKALDVPNPRQLAALSFDHIILRISMFITNLPYPQAPFVNFAQILIQQASLQKETALIKQLQGLVHEAHGLESVPVSSLRSIFGIEDQLTHATSHCCPSFVKHLFTIRTNLLTLHENFKNRQLNLCHILRGPFAHMIHHPVEQEDSWLDVIDPEESQIDASPFSEADEKEHDAASPIDLAPTTPTVEPKTILFTLPSSLPSNPTQTIELFRELSDQVYQLPHPHNSPLDVQKFSSHQDFAIRQHYFALDCLKTVVALRSLSTTPQHRELLTSLFFVWQHQAIEQPLTHFYTRQFPKKSIPHHLHTLMTEQGIAGEYRTLKDNDDATRYFRYPFALSTSTEPLALRHIRTTSEHPAELQTTTLDVKAWLTEMMTLLATIPISAQVQTDFMAAVQQLIAHLSNEEESEKTDNAGSSKYALTDVQKNSLRDSVIQLQGFIPILRTAIDRLSTGEPYYRKKISTFKTILHHCNCLSVSIDLLNNFPHRQFLFLHALTQQLATQYLAESVGTYLSLSMQDPLYTHDLMEFCNQCQLDLRLTSAQKQLLEAINLQKGSEYLYKRFPQKEDKLPYARMSWLSALYEQSRLEEKFTNGSKKVDTVQMQAKLVQEATALSDLSIALLQMVI